MAGVETFLFATALTPALEIIQPSTEWILGLFPWGQNDRDVQLNTHLFLMLRLRIYGAIPPIPYMFPRRGAQSSTETNLLSILTKLKT
jgi:hypothetical protein